MARFIDADKLVEHIKDLPTWRELLGVGWRSTKYPNGMFDCEDIINSIKNQPTADVVEVVRCKDCRNRYEKNWAKCHGRKPDDFCSDGERKKTDEQK